MRTHFGVVVSASEIEASWLKLGALKEPVAV